MKIAYLNAVNRCFLLIIRRIRKSLIALSILYLRLTWLIFFDVYKRLSSFFIFLFFFKKTFNIRLYSYRLTIYIFFTCIEALVIIIEIIIKIIIIIILLIL